MNPLRTYDYLARVRQRIFDAVRPLRAEDYAREFPIGPGTLARTLTHILSSEWYYVQRMTRRDVPPYEQWLMRDQDPPSFAVLESAWMKQADETASAIRGIIDWSAPIEYPSMGDDEQPMIVTATPLEIFTQLVLHEVHHRAQVINMLRHLGVEIGDLDFNAMMYQRRPA